MQGLLFITWFVFYTWLDSSLCELLEDTGEKVVHNMEN